MADSKVQRYQDTATTQNPWYFSKQEGRDYLTPEDVDDAIKAGCTPVTALRVVCEAVESKSVEDPSLCAFIALEYFEKNRPRRK